MDPLIIFIIVGSIVGFILGAIVGLFIARRNGGDKVEEEPGQTPEAMASETDQHMVEPPAPLTQRKLEDYQPLVCLWRGRESGDMAIEIKGKLYPTSSDFDLKAKAHLIHLNQEWTNWLGVTSDQGKSGGPQAPVQEKAPAPDRTAARPAAAPPAASESIPVIDKDESAALEVDDLRSKTIVEQIDEILQEKLSASAHANRSIRIMEGPNKGVVVWIGLTHYNGIDEVDDPEVLEIIRSAVAEWEARAGGKRR